jgi:hypothetical protein
MDSGANICINNSLAFLIDVVDITPFTFSLGRDGAMHSVDDCCTKRGLLPLAMDHSIPNHVITSKILQKLSSLHRLLLTQGFFLLGTRWDTKAASRVQSSSRVRVVSCQ